MVKSIHVIVVALMISSVGIISIIGNSYAQNPPNIIIYLQIKVQDSKGNLVSYMEVSKISITDLAKLNLLLNQDLPVYTKTLMTSGNQKFEVIRATNIVVHHSATIVSQNMISASTGQTSQVLAIADHDGYPVVPGDKVTTYWTIIRPAA